MALRDCRNNRQRRTGIVVPRCALRGWKGCKLPMSGSTDDLRTSFQVVENLTAFDIIDKVHVRSGRSRATPG
jgi:hypothetical protein